MQVNDLETLLVDQLKDIYSAEKQLLKALPKMAKAASAKGLRGAIEKHFRETEGQVKRLESIADTLGERLTGKKCKAMEGLIEEGKEALEIEGPDAIIDLAIIAAAQRVEHYEISAYGSARSLAEKLDLAEVASLLQETLDEESAADEKMTAVSEKEVMPEVQMDNSKDEKAPKRRSKRTR